MRCDDVERHVVRRDKLQELAQIAGLTRHGSSNLKLGTDALQRLSRDLIQLSYKTVKTTKIAFIIKFARTL